MLHLTEPAYMQAASAAARAPPIRPHSSHTLETEGDSILHRPPYSCLLVGYELRSLPGLVASSVLERICVTHRSRLAGNTWSLRTWITKPSGKEQVESSSYQAGLPSASQGGQVPGMCCRSHLRRQSHSHTSSRENPITPGALLCPPRPLSLQSSLPALDAESAELDLAGNRREHLTIRK